MIDQEIQSFWLARKITLPIYNYSGQIVFFKSLKLVQIEQNNCTLIVEGMLEKFKGYSCNQALDGYRRQLDENNLLVGCFGAVENFYVTKGMARRSFGLLGCMTEFGKTPVTNAGLPIKATFAECNLPEKLCSVLSQRQFRFDSMKACQTKN